MADIKIQKKIKLFILKNKLTFRKSKNGIFFYYKHKFEDIKNFESYLSFQENNINLALKMIQQDYNIWKKNFKLWIIKHEKSLKTYYLIEYKKVKKDLK